MATKKSRKSNGRRGRTSSQAGRINYGGLSGWLKRFGHRNLVIAALFVLAFAGLGGFYIYRSYAYVSCSPYSTVLVGGSTGQCVKDAEQMLYNIGARKHDAYPGFSASPALGYYSGGAWHADGIFGNGMYLQVVSYQKDRQVRDGPTYGKIAYNTWWQLCQENVNFLWVWNNAGCAVLGY
jgi:hypothetical protein